MESVSDRIKSKREELKFSQEYMADHLGITSRAYQNYEYGREPGIDRLREIAGILGVTLNELLGEQSVRPENINDFRQDIDPEMFTSPNTTDREMKIVPPSEESPKREKLEDTVKVQAETILLLTKKLLASFP